MEIATRLVIYAASLGVGGCCGSLLLAGRLASRLASGFCSIVRALKGALLLLSRSQSAVADAAMSTWTAGVG
jgi:hypothetical protein